jgi:hypothetical protein
MSERDPFELAEAQEREAEDLQRHGEEVERSVRETREDWQHKRADKSVPGANPPEEDTDGDEARESPAPQAPPPSAGPGDAETPAEGGAGPPADVIDDEQG